ncbi:MAG: DUF3137 domain-containing protein [bacterium]|nr:DUF3137 domain-containing protein [bacterium]
MDFKELEAERQKRLAAYKKRLKVGLIVIGCGILAIILGFLLLRVEKIAELAKVIIILGFLTVGVGIGISSSRFAIAKKYSREFKQPLVLTLLKKWYDNANYEEHGRIPLAEIMNSGLLTRRPDRVHMEDLIEGSFHNVGFRVCDAHLEEEHTYTDSKGNTHTEWITFFRGRWYQFMLNRSFDTVIRIKEKKRIKEMITKGLEKVEVESIDFTDKFMAYAKDEHWFFYIFTPVVVEKMMELEKMHKGRFMFSIEGNIINIGIDDNRDYLEISLKTPIDEKSIRAYETQINIMAAIISEFRFDTEKYNPVDYSKMHSGEINVSEDEIADFINQGVKNAEQKLENLDNVVEAKLNQIDNMDAESAANEVEKIDTEVEEIENHFDNL